MLKFRLNLETAVKAAVDLIFAVYENIQCQGGRTMGVRHFLVGLIALLTIVLVCSSYAEIAPGEIVGIWLFDENGGEIAGDSSGNGHDGDLVNGPEWVDGKFGSALEFDGNWVEVPDSPELNPESMLTLTAWVRPISFPGYSPIFNKEWSAPKRQYSLGYPSDRRMGLWFDNQGGTEDSIRATTTFSEDTWYFVAATFDEGEVQIFVDGELEGNKVSASVTALRTEDTENLCFGSEKGNRSLNGGIDEVAMFNVALTEDDIRHIMNNGLEETTGIAAVSSASKLTTTWADLKK